MTFNSRAAINIVQFLVSFQLCTFHAGAFIIKSKSSPTKDIQHSYDPICFPLLGNRILVLQFSGGFILARYPFHFSIISSTLLFLLFSFLLYCAKWLDLCVWVTYSESVFFPKPNFYEYDFGNRYFLLSIYLETPGLPVDPIPDIALQTSRIKLQAKEVGLRFGWINYLATFYDVCGVWVGAEKGCKQRTRHWSTLSSTYTRGKMSFKYGVVCLIVLVWASAYFWCIRKHYYWIFVKRECLY